MSCHFFFDSKVWGSHGRRPSVTQVDAKRLLQSRLKLRVEDEWDLLRFFAPAPHSPPGRDCDRSGMKIEII